MLMFPPVVLQQSHPAPLPSPTGCCGNHEIAPSPSRPLTFSCHTRKECFFINQIVTTKWSHGRRTLNISHSSLRNAQLPMSLEGRACINSKRERAEVKPCPAWHSTLPSVMEMMRLLWLQTVLLNYWLVSQYLSVFACASTPLLEHLK